MHQLKSYFKTNGIIHSKKYQCNHFINSKKFEKNMNSSMKGNLKMHLEYKGLIFLEAQLQICFGAKEHFKENDV
jgi:hypothetical protein